ncbi:MAG: TrbI/VirB10 family protein [Acetobacter aceti]|uniref:Uncharacterized protein n=1 Tax=Acetobacter aceti TaxID=435 RepID=A0A1U9KIA5_ACEAC|nr:TrbI/VirB10 family protein [Acetobacter aceti]AQS85486.1 hypothetical protein A0U92_12630 [Acetobacter aceti]
MTNEASVLVDNDAANKAADADLALQSLGADDVGQAYITATITVWDGSASIAAEKLRLVEKIIQSRDFTCMTESLNAVEAWLGSLPGHVYANVRQPPVSTLNLAHMIPLSAVWAGPEQDGHLRAAPLFYGRTAGATPFRFSLHVGDVGHTLIAGPTGAGKSVLLALMVLQFRRYQGAQVFAFDFGGSMRAATLAMGGDWHDLGGGLTDDDGHFAVSFQPLAQIDDPDERKWASEWLVLEKLPGGDAIGQSGLSDEVNNHWGQLFRAALVTTLLSVGSEAGTSWNENNLMQAIRSGASNGFSMVGNRLIDRSLNVQPTLTDRPGLPFTLILNRDLALTPWEEKEPRP